MSEENKFANKANPNVDQQLELNGVQVSWGPRVTQIVEDEHGIKTEVSEPPREGEEPYHWSVYARTRPASENASPYIGWSWEADVASEELAYLVATTTLGYLARK